MRDTSVLPLRPIPDMLIASISYAARDARLARLQRERDTAMQNRKQLLADKAAQQERHQTRPGREDCY